LFTIPSPLLQTFQSSHSYLATGCELLMETLALEAQLRPAFYSEPVPGGADFYMHCLRLDFGEAYKVFLKIRDLRERVEAQYPLLSQPAAQLDYLAHMAVNILPTTDKKARKLAFVGDDRKTFSYDQTDRRLFQYSVAAHFGISPEPLFGGALHLNDAGVARSLSAFGFGLYAYLGYLVIPCLADLNCMPPELALEWQRRPPAPAKIARSENGSYFLDPR
jgi:hypothetical protein